MAGKQSGRRHFQPLRPRARLLHTVGDELISSETVALIELVKNAYDADATRVLIRFHRPLEQGRGSIEVMDNGHGMSLETIRTAWMEPATPARRGALRRRSEQRGRRVLGEKGIGRFAASRLADRLEVVTRRSGMAQETRVVFDWTAFDDEDKYLDEVQIPWEQVPPEEVCPSGTIGLLWAEDETPSAEDLNHGTILRMERLRSDWTESDLSSLRVGLARLISPFFGENGRTGDKFEVRLSLPSPFAHLGGAVEVPEGLHKPHYLIKGAVSANGSYVLNIKVRGRTRFRRLRGRFVLPDGHVPACGPFRVELRVWDRDPSSMLDLAQQYGSTIVDVRHDLDAVAGISIYRDGFRVLPYGDPRNDWLRLDLRRVQNPTLRLSNNQIVGYILISAEENPLLRDQSNREGLMEGPALDDLRELVVSILAKLEQQRYAVRPRRRRMQGQPGGLFVGFDLTGVRDSLSRRHPDDTELLNQLDEKQEDLERRVGLVQEVLSRYRRLATLGQLVDTVLHDGRAPLAKIGNEAHLARRDIERHQNEPQKLLDRLAGRFDTIASQSGVLSTVFARVEPFGGRKRGRPARLCLEDVIAEAFAVLETEVAEVGVQVQLPRSKTFVTMDQAETQEVIINLLQNSLYWLRHVPPKARRISVSVSRTDESEVSIVFSDSGPGVEAEFRDRIFEPYFSTKPAGVGLGLTIAGEIVTDYYAGSLELLDSGPLPGATFRVTLRRRV